MNAFVLGIVCSGSLKEGAGSVLRAQAKAQLEKRRESWAALGLCSLQSLEQSGWFRGGVSITFAFVLANKGAVFGWLVFS